MFGTVVVGVAGRGLDADDLEVAVVCWQVLMTYVHRRSFFLSFFPSFFSTLVMSALCDLNL